MKENKTQKTKESVTQYLNTLSEDIQADCKKIDSFMKKAAKADGKMWGAAIIGYGDIHLKYDSGRELDWFKVGFSPRKTNITLYLGSKTLADEKLLSKLGKYKTGKGCLYIKTLKEIDESVLEKMIVNSVKG